MPEPRSACQRMMNGGNATTNITRALAFFWLGAYRGIMIRAGNFR
jgi:hypothetical protein